MMALSNNEVWADLELKNVIKEAVGGEKLGRACLGARHLHVTILHQVQLGVAPSYSYSSETNIIDMFSKCYLTLNVDDMPLQNRKIKIRPKR